MCLGNTALRYFIFPPYFLCRNVGLEKVMPLIVQEIRYLDKLIDELTRENLWIKSFADEQEVRGIKCGNVQNAAVHLRIQIRIIIAARLQKQLKNI